MSTVPSLSENTAPDGTDVIYSTDGTNDEKVQIKNLLKGSGAEVPAAKITGTVAHEQGGLEADVSAYSGLVKITGGATSAVADPNATVTTKGDLLVRGASALGRVAIGTNDQVLTADSAEASGVKWADVDSGTIAHERGGLEADVSAYSGLVKITGGATSAVTAPTGAIVGTTDTQTLTNKRINPRTGSTTSSSSLTITSDTYDQYSVTALAAAMTINAPTGTPVQGQKLVIRIKDDATARALTWNAIFRAVGAELPTTTSISKYIYVGCIYNSTDTKWDVVAAAEEA